MLDPKDGVSNPSSLLSSTVVHDGTFQSNNNKNQTNQGGKSQKRFSPSSKYASLLSDPGIPDEMDENVPRESLYQPKGQKANETPQNCCDLTVPPDPKRFIYKITNEFPVQRPYSAPADWQKVLSRHSMQQQTVINDQPVDPNDDGLAENLLNLPNRNWIKDQIQMHMENQNVMQDSLDSLVK